MKIDTYYPEETLFGDLLLSLGRADAIKWVNSIRLLERTTPSRFLIDQNEVMACFGNKYTMLQILGVEECELYTVSNPHSKFKASQSSYVPIDFFDNVYDFIENEVSAPCDFRPIRRVANSVSQPPKTVGVTRRTFHGSHRPKDSELYGELYKRYGREVSELLVTNRSGGYRIRARVLHELRGDYSISDFFGMMPGTRLRASIWHPENEWLKNPDAEYITVPLEKISLFI